MKERGLSMSPGFSVAKTLSRLQNAPANRTCADCRSTLVDSSQIHASVSPVIEQQPARALYNNFRLNHQSFVPPGLASSIPETFDPPVDPHLLATSLIGGHGVFVCGLCGAAHKLLGSSIAVVHPVQDVSSWTPEEVQHLAVSGGNSRATTVFEAFLPPSWEAKRPHSESGVSERLKFIRAKYEALAFVLPPPGPLSYEAWTKILSMHNNWIGLWDADLTSSSLRDTEVQESAVASIREGFAFAPEKAVLPERLVDYFCVVTPSDYVDPLQLDKDLSVLNSPEDLLLVPQISDCYPAQGAYEGHDFPEHVSTFLFPDGCRPSSSALPPSFFTFVLTSSRGDRLYGAVLHLYDDDHDIEHLRHVLKNSGYKGNLPDWLAANSAEESNDSFRSDVVFLPKCLVVLSHYAFFDLWRKLLLMLYRIVLTEAPLPIERFITNFFEVPLPPPGKIQVKFGFTVNEHWTIRRPPENRLPLADFSFKPLFASLSVSNVIIVMACLLQETRVALVSRYYALLGPVAEALTSLLFPLHWEGMYLPVMPYSMLDVLEAPVPYLVGLHSRFLVETPPRCRPRGVVFVDLDRDEVHLGFEDDSDTPRQIPCLPERRGMKLKAKVDEFAGSVYVVPPSGNVATVTCGEGDPIPTNRRESYLRDANPSGPNSSLRRRDVFSNANKAYRENELQSVSGFLSEHGQLYEREVSSTMKGNRNGKLRFRQKTQPTITASNDSMDSAQHSNNLLDMDEPAGFSSREIRNAFLRFFVSLFQDYRQFLGKRFNSSGFLASLNGSARSTELVSRLLKSQMFDRFLEERREKDDPEVKFFDESINAKTNRSMKSALTNIGRTGGIKRKETSFLDDTSSSWTETYTPPPPSNWGLPDDGRSYSYGTFPTPLNPTLFGKRRPQRKWTPSHRRRASLRMSQRRLSAKTQVSERAVIAKAMAPAKLWSATRRRAVDALSSPFAGLSPKKSGASRASHRQVLSIVSEITLPSELEMFETPTEEDVVLNERRRQAVLVGIIIVLQKHCRMWLARAEYRRRLSQTTLEPIPLSVLEAESIRVKRQSDAATRLQGCIRALRVRQALCRMRQAAVLLQSCFRGWRTRDAFLLIRRTIAKAQSLCRGYVVRQRLSFLLQSRLQLYRKHIFVLWRQAGTSLCYRSRLWLLIKKDGLLQLAIAEDEIIRLWSDLSVQPPRYAEQSTCAQESTKAGIILGVRTNIHWQVLKLSENFDETEESIATAGSRNAVTGREAAERVQIYERLSTDDRLSDYCGRFSMKPTEKMKKAALAATVWHAYEQADSSTAMMLSLFPELRDSTTIHFVEPSRKALRRFRSIPSSPPEPLERSMWAHTFLDDRIRRDVAQVADLCLRKVPTLSLRLAAKLDRDMEVRNARTRRGADSSRSRIALMKSLLFSSEAERTTANKVKAAKSSPPSENGKEFWVTDENQGRNDSANSKDLTYPGQDFWMENGQRTNENYPGASFWVDQHQRNN